MLVRKDLHSFIYAWGLCSNFDPYVKSDVESSRFECRYLFSLSPCPGPCDHRLHLCPLESESPVMTLNSHLEVK